MENSALETIERIRSAVRTTLEHDRAKIRHSGSWITFEPFYYYMLDLSPASLLHVRLHAQLFGGGDPTGLLGGLSHLTPESFKSGYGYGHATHEIPERYLVSEPAVAVNLHELAGPETLPRFQPLGVEIDGRWVSPDTARYQNYISNLYRIGFIQWLERQPRKVNVIEFGAGYGAFGYYLMKLFPGKINYIVVDLPMMLLFPGCYIAANVPGVKAWTVDARDPKNVDLDDGNDLYLVPNHHLNLLDDVDRIDLAINTISFPEMGEDAVAYTDFLKERLTGPFLYHNQEAATDSKTFDVVRSRLSCLPNPAVFFDYARDRGEAIVMQDMIAFNKDKLQFIPNLFATVYLRMTGLSYIETTLGSNIYKISPWPIPPRPPRPLRPADAPPVQQAASRPAPAAAPLQPDPAPGEDDDAEALGIADRS